MRHYHNFTVARRYIRGVQLVQFGDIGDGNSLMVGCGVLLD